MLELMMALAISAIIISFIGMALIGAARMNTLSQAHNHASTLAEQKIEHLRRFSFSNIQSGVDTTYDNNIRFVREWTVTDNMGKPRIKDVELKVTWTDSKGVDHVSIYNTIFYRNAYPYR